MDTKKFSPKIKAKGPTENEAIDHYIELPTVLRPRVEVAPSIEQFVKKKLEGVNETKISDAISSKINDKFMSLNQRKKKTNLHKEKKKKYKLMTSKKRKALKLFELPPECEKYDLYLPLHHLWKDYINDLIGTHSYIEPLMVKADYHGAFIKVIQSKTPELVGLEGIILQETMNTFKIITKEDKYKVIPKANSVFSFVAGDKLVTVYGNQIVYRSSERSVKKFKRRSSIEL